MSQHTPGPWTAKRCEHGWHIGPQPDGACSIYDNSDGTRKDEQAANARLIAKAPAMLELLKNVRPIVSDYDFRYHAGGRELCDELYRLIADDEASSTDP